MPQNCTYEQCLSKLYSILYIITSKFWHKYFLFFFFYLTYLHLTLCGGSPTHLHPICSKVFHDGYRVLPWIYTGNPWCAISLDFSHKKVHLLVCLSLKCVFEHGWKLRVIEFGAFFSHNNQFLPVHYDSYQTTDGDRLSPDKKISHGSQNEEVCSFSEAGQ